MVKGISRQVIVVHAPEPKLFEQAIFILKEDAVGEGISDDALLKEAQKPLAASGKAAEASHFPLAAEKFIANILGNATLLHGAGGICQGKVCLVQDAAYEVKLALAYEAARFVYGTCCHGFFLYVASGMSEGFCVARNIRRGRTSGISKASNGLLGSYYQ